MTSSYDHIEDHMSDDFLNNVDPHSFACPGCALSAFFFQLNRRRNLPLKIVIQMLLKIIVSSIDQSTGDNDGLRDDAIAFTLTELCDRLDIAEGELVADFSGDPPTSSKH